MCKIKDANQSIFVIVSKGLDMFEIQTSNFTWFSLRWKVNFVSNFLTFYFTSATKLLLQNKKPFHFYRSWFGWSLQFGECLILMGKTNDCARVRLVSLGLVWKRNLRGDDCKSDVWCGDWFDESCNVFIRMFGWKMNFQKIEHFSDPMNR